MTEIAKTTKIFDNCHIFTDFAKIYDFETVPKRFKKCVDGNFQDDDFSDEICLAIETSRGIVVIVGCSHPGILNIVSQIKNTLNKPVFAIIGGTHLVEADAMRISKTVSEFENLGVQYLGLGHCTGDIAENLIKDSKKFNTFHLSAGDSVNFE